MQHFFADTRRMRAARQKLAQTRMRIRRLSWMAREPANLDRDLPVLSRTAFVRAMARFQAIRLREEKAALLVLRLDRENLALRRAVAMHLLENTRNCDAVGCADTRTFLVLLKGADEKGAQTAQERLYADIRRLAVRMGYLLRILTFSLPVADAPAAADIMHAVDARIRELDNDGGVAHTKDVRMIASNRPA